MFTFFVRWPYLGDPAADFDEQLYQLIGQQMLHGAVPFVDLWDRKPIGLFLIYATANIIGGESIWSYQLLACASTIWAAALIFSLARPFTDTVGAVTAALLYIIYLSAFGSYVGQSEVFFIPLLLLMTKLATRLLAAADQSAALRLCYQIILLGGLCLQIKYTVLPQCMFFGILCLWKLRMLGMPYRVLTRHAGQFALVGLVPTLCVTAFYLTIGQFDAFAFANFWSIFQRGPLSGVLKDFYRAQVTIMAFPLFVIACAGALALSLRKRRIAPGYILVGGWTVSAFLSATMVGNIYIHYFATVIPGLVILASPALRMNRLGAVLSSLAMLFGLLFFNPARHHQISMKSRAGFEGVVKLASPFIGKHHDCLYVYDGPTALYHATQSCLPTRFIYPDHLNNAQEENALGINTEYEVGRILADRPGVIITASEPVVPVYNRATSALVSKTIARNYVRIGSFRYFPRVLFVNVRRDLVVAGHSSR